MTELNLALTGDLAAYFKQVNAAVDRGIRGGLRRTTFGMRNGIRTRIRRSGGFNTRFDQLVVASVKGRGLDAVGTVRSVARYDKGARTGPVDLVSLFSQGATIRAANGEWLAVPTGRGPITRARGKARLATPREAESYGFKLTFIRENQNRAVIINAPRREVWWVLVKRITLRKRYDLDPYVDKWSARFPQILADEVNKAHDRSPNLQQLSARLNG